MNLTKVILAAALIVAGAGCAGTAKPTKAAPLTTITTRPWTASAADSNPTDCARNAALNGATWWMDGTTCYFNVPQR